MKVVIVAKTRMGSGACIGALTFDGRSLRLIAADRETNDQFNMDYQVGEVWEVDTRPDPEITPPHIENVIVTNKRRMGPITGIETFIEQQMPPVCGDAKLIFEGLAQTTKMGSLYISERTGLPSRSTMFWIPDQPLQRVDDLKRIRYRYPTNDRGPTLTFTGFQEPIPEIPAGALLRVSLAHWWRPGEMPDGEYRCYVQLSGWFLTEQAVSIPYNPSTESTAQQDLDIHPQLKKETFEGQIPNIQGVLHEIFGYPEFRPLQAKIIANILRKRDSLAVMPTGSGKSLCYQLPATLFPGLTVVVSPLIALMEDQVLELREWGIPAVYLNSTLSHSEYIDTKAQIRACQVKLLYAAPETLLRPETMVLLEDCRVDCLVIDEAHCISEWGHDFRPEYRQLAGLRAHLPQAVTLAVTATATQRVRQDIKKSLRIKEANEFISSFNRENLVIYVTDKITPDVQTRAFLDAHREQAGIIYCATRDQVDQLTIQLEADGYPVLSYHAGLDDDIRRAHQHRFRYEEGLIMVATIAFGMGINKSNLRFILHYDLPKNLESYYQQIGRAGRDGLPAECLLLYSYSDIHTIRYFIEQESPELRRGSEMRLNALLSFVSTRACRRIPLLNYFGERYPAVACNACDNCLADGSEVSIVPGRDDRVDVEGDSAKADLSTPARQLIICAQETGEIFGADHLINILRGSKAKKVLKFNHEKLGSYETGSAFSKKQWQHLAAQFIRMGLLERTPPHGSLKVTPAGHAVLQGQEVWGQLPGRYAPTAVREMPEHAHELFEQLRALRAQLASERDIPPYVIFHDRSLIEMATYFPRTSAQLGRIYGVGARKLEEYGPHILPVIQAYCREHEIEANIPTPVIVPSRHAVPSVHERTETIWEQFQAGESMSTIAADLGFTEGTILSHLEKAFTAGRALDVSNLCAASPLSPEEGQQVIDAFEVNGANYLKPVFEALNGAVTYDQLRLWRLIYKVKTQDD
jgi:ATP-dependent DNA helicase RecQ